MQNNQTTYAAFALFITGKLPGKSVADVVKVCEEICSPFEDATGSAIANENPLYINICKEVALLCASYNQIQVLMSGISALNEAALMTGTSSLAYIGPKPSDAKLAEHSTNFISALDETVKEFGERTCRLLQYINQLKSKSDGSK